MIIWYNWKSQFGINRFTWILQMRGISFCTYPLIIILMMYTIYLFAFLNNVSISITFYCLQIIKWQPNLGYKLNSRVGTIIFRLMYKWNIQSSCWICKLYYVNSIFYSARVPLCRKKRSEFNTDQYGPNRILQCLTRLYLLKERVYSQLI